MKEKNIISKKFLIFSEKESGPSKSRYLHIHQILMKKSNKSQLGPL
jgi:hypothetical protein